jgi:hypothetical protein
VSLVEVLRDLAFLLAAGTVGGMLFFGAGVAPVVFRVLEPETAGRLIRALFPRYYLGFALSCALAALLAAPVVLTAALLLAMAGAGFVYARQSLMPRINDLRDRAKAGEPGTQERFDRLHKVSVQLNMTQLVAILAALAMLAMGV